MFGAKRRQHRMDRPKINRQSWHTYSNGSSHDSCEWYRYVYINFPKRTRYMWIRPKVSQTLGQFPTGSFVPWEWKRFDFCINGCEQWFSMQLFRQWFDLENVPRHILINSWHFDVQWVSHCKSSSPLNKVIISTASLLTRWHLMKHIWTGYHWFNRIIIGSDNGLWPVRRQAITWIGAYLFLNWTPMNKFQWNSNQCPLQKTHSNLICKMSVNLFLLFLAINQILMINDWVLKHLAISVHSAN